MRGVINKTIVPADVVNNLTTTSAGKILDARQGKTLNDNKLAKAGDTMTGNLNSKQAGFDITAADNGVSETTYFNPHALQDENGVYSGALGQIAYANGDMVTRLVVANRVDGASSTTGLGIGKRKDGSLFFQVGGDPGASAFRDAIHAPLIGERITLTTSSGITIVNTSGSTQIMNSTNQGFNQYRFIDLFFSMQGRLVDGKRIWTLNGTNTSFSFGMTMNHTDDGVRDLVVAFDTDGRYIRNVVVKLRNNSGSGAYITNDTWLKLVGAYGYKD